MDFIYFNALNVRPVKIQQINEAITGSLLTCANIGRLAILIKALMSTKIYKRLLAKARPDANLCRP